MIRVNFEKNYKDWQIIDGDDTIIKATKPKWYSSEVRFFYNGKTYQLKKKSFGNQRLKYSKEDNLSDLSPILI